MVDNSELIKKLMHWEIKGDVYYVQVMKRRKDGADRDGVIIRDFHIHSIEQFEREYPIMKQLAEDNKARVMVRLNQRNTLDANLRASIEAMLMQIETNRVMRKMIRTGDTSLMFPDPLSVCKLYSSALGKTNTEASETRKWIVDIDSDMVDENKPGYESLSAIADTLSEVIVTKCTTKDKKTGTVNVPKIYCKLPSKHGLHLVTSTFNVGAFMTVVGKPKNQEKYIMEDANTNIYIPDSCYEAENG